MFKNFWFDFLVVSCCKNFLFFSKDQSSDLGDSCNQDGEECFEGEFSSDNNNSSDYEEDDEEEVQDDEQQQQQDANQDQRMDQNGTVLTHRVLTFEASRTNQIKNLNLTGKLAPEY